MNVDKEIRSTGKLIFLHLFPGIALCIMYIFFSKVGILAGYPHIVILGFSMIFSTILIKNCILLDSKLVYYYKDWK